MTPIVTTLEVELLLIEYMTSDPDLPDFGKVMRFVDSIYKSSEPEGFCTYSINPEPLVDPVDCGIGVTYEPR